MKSESGIDGYDSEYVDIEGDDDNAMDLNYSQRSSGLASEVRYYCGYDSEYVDIEGDDDNAMDLNYSQRSSGLASEVGGYYDLGLNDWRMPNRGKFSHQFIFRLLLP